MRIKREDDIVPDTSALCGFAIAMLLIIVLCWTLMCSVGCDATLFEGGAFPHGLALPHCGDYGSERWRSFMRR